MSERLAEQPNVASRFQKGRGVRVPQVMGRMLDTRLIEHLPIQLLKVRRRILGKSVARREKILRIAVLHLQEQLAEFFRDGIVDRGPGLLTAGLDAESARLFCQFVFRQSNGIDNSQPSLAL